MGVSATRSPGAPSADTGSGTGTSDLPRTGASLLALAALGLSMAGVGTAATRLGKAGRTG
jgi:hypothetical protein